MKRRISSITVNADVEIDIDVFLEEIDDDQLMDEVRNRKLLRTGDKKNTYHLLCDHFGLPIWVGKDRIVKEVQEAIQ